MTTVNYEKIYQFLATKKGKIITVSSLAYGIGVDYIYGPTIAKLVRDGALEVCANQGFYRVV